MIFRTFQNIFNCSFLLLYVKPVIKNIFHSDIFRHVYLYCESAKTSDKGFEFEIKPYSPAITNLQDIAAKLKVSSESDSKTPPPWLNYLKGGLNVLSGQAEQDFSAPSADTDKLYMSIGERDLIEVAHPAPLDKAVKR